MKIALIVPQMAVGGIESFALNMGDILSRAGHVVTVVAFQQGDWWPRIAAAGLRGIHLPPSRIDSVVGYVRRIIRFLAQERFDLLLVNIGSFLRPVQLALPFLPDGMDVVPIVHNDRPKVYDTVSLNALAWNVAIAVSPQVQQTLTARLPHRPILHIPCGTVLPFEQDLRTRAAWGLPFKLLYVGRIQNRQKNVFLLSDIMTICMRRRLDICLTVIGDGHDRSRLEQRFAAQEVTQLVDMRGAQPPASVYQAMQQHHALLLPSHHEGFPLVLLEAQANGCVPLASRLLNSTDVAIEDGITGLLVAPGDADGFAEGIVTMQDPDRWQIYSQAGIERAHRLFSTKVMGERYLRLVEEIQQGSYPLPMPRAALRRQAHTLFTWKDYLPLPLCHYLSWLRQKWSHRKVRVFPISKDA